MHRSSAALRVTENEHRMGQVFPLSTEYKRAPKHFKFNLSLIEQAERHRIDYGFKDEEIAPTVEFINSRQWTPATLPAGADAWVVGTRSHALGDRQIAIATSLRKLTLRSPLPLINEVAGVPDGLYRSNRTASCMALLQQVQPRSPLIVMAVQVGLRNRHECLSLVQAEARFASNEFCLGDVEFSNVCQPSGASRKPA
jgi:hypothetical protein